MRKMQVKDIISIQFVRRFPQEDDVRRKQFEFEDKLKGTFNDPPQVASRANVGPQPFYVFKAAKKNFVVTANAVQLNLSFDNFFTANEDLTKMLSKYSELMDDICDNILSYQQRYFAGVVVTFTKKVEGGSKAVAKEIANELFDLPELDNGSTQVSIGFDVDEYSYNLSVAGVETYSFKVDSPGRVLLDGDFMQPEDTGVEVKLDVNNRRRSEKLDNKIFSGLVTRFYDLAKTAPSVIKGFAPDV